MQVQSTAECSKGGNSSILQTFIKLPFVIKILVLSIFEWLLKTGLTVHSFDLILYVPVNSYGHVCTVSSTNGYHTFFLGKLD